MASRADSAAIWNLGVLVAVQDQHRDCSKLIAQKTDVLVAPILPPGISPYHMEFPGTITLSADTVQRVYKATWPESQFGIKYKRETVSVGGQFVRRFCLSSPAL